MAPTFPPVRELIPHHGPAVLIDEVLDDTPDSIRAAAQITNSHPFFVAGHGVPSWVGIELMAQAIAAHAGLEARRDQGTPRAGMLLGTRRYSAHAAWFRAGTRLEIHARREFGERGGVAACACRIECEGTLLAEASIIIVEIDETHANNMGIAR